MEFVFLSLLHGLEFRSEGRMAGGRLGHGHGLLQVADDAHHTGFVGLAVGAEVKYRLDGADVDWLPNRAGELKAHVRLGGIVTGHRNALLDRTTVTGRIELDGDGAGFSRLDQLVPSSRRSAAATGPDLADFERLVAGLVKMKSCLTG